MNISLILFGVLPLIAFVIIDSFMGLKAGLISAIALAIVEAIYTLYQFGSIDSVTVASLVLVCAFALISFKSNNAIYMKLQPVFLGLAFGAVLLVMQSMGKPLLLMMFEKYDTLIPEEYRANFKHPQVLLMLARLSLILGFGFIIHAGLVAYAAFRLSNWWWLIIRGIGLYIMLFLCCLLVRF